MRKQEKKALITNDKKSVSVAENDGTNRPVPGVNGAPKSSESEAALFKQAENPLGDPHKA